MITAEPGLASQRKSPFKAAAGGGCPGTAREALSLVLRDAVLGV